jgi:hypothetical protein
MYVIQDFLAASSSHAIKDYHSQQIIDQISLNYTTTDLFNTGSRVEA